jgi:hypothetical protein
MDATCTPPANHNTKYCQVDSTGKILSSDQITAQNQQGGVYSIGGGCIARPIRDVWGVLFNNDVMKPSNVDEYNSTPRPDLMSSTQPQILFIFDIFNQHNVPLINPSWTIRWFHSVTYGTFEAPDEVAVNYQKISGTSYISQLQGGYVLDRVTDSVTSWVSEEFVNATQYDTGTATTGIQADFVRMRTGAPELPAQPMTPPAQ